MKSSETSETREMSRASRNANAQSRSQTGAPGWLALLLLLLGTAAHAEVGNGLSSAFNVDTRWGGGTSSGVSGFFTVNTRFSGSTGEGSSALFAVDTRGAGIGSAGISGYVGDASDVGLSGAMVSALQNGVLRAQTASDFAGAYALVSLPEGTYQVQAAKAGYLTVNRYGINVAANQSVPLGFLLTIRPAGPAVVVTTRPQEPVTTVVITNTQLKKFNGSGFVTGYTLDLSKKTVVFTHGWNSNPDVWATNMAASMIAGGVADANLLAWDWRGSAGTGLLLSRALSAVPREGEKLGQALAQALGGSYGQPIHFIGHSLGTLVNARAANHLHENTGGAFAAQNTHITLLDDAAIANIEGTFVQLGYTLAGVYAPYEVGSIFNCGWLSPVPRATVRWMDNYISLVGGYHAEAVNTFLAKAPDYANPNNPAAFVTSVHGYVCKWYGDTAANPNQSLLGNRYSFEQLGNSAAFPSPSPYPLGSFFSQSPGSGQEFSLTQLHTAAEINAVVNRHVGAFARVGVQSSLNFAVGVAQKIGSVAVDVGMAFIPHTPSGTPVYSGTAGSTPMYYTDSPVETLPAWSFQVNLLTQPGSSAQFSPSFKNENSPKGGSSAGPDMTNNQPACVWIPVQIPTNAAVFAFDFTFNGEPASDLLSASINSTNVFALEARFMPTNTTLNSGPIDVSPWAGQTVELFFGLVGGTSTNAGVTLDGMRFYNVIPPFLTAQVFGSNALIQWPLSANGYVLETTADLATTNAWTTVTNAPTIVDLQNTVTNPVSGGSSFYRLRK